MSLTKFVITTKIVGKKVYVVYASTPIENGKIVVTYNGLIDDALEFNTEEEANTFIDKIINPYDRVFNVENK